ncbi:FtsX-like permease family protein [Promethearchaeum syntrophicum]|uniref:FtsX-like permease family protein n=1 Tax=Promethearchaeum syntrophicum TaxID=2594042 RepID=A0A5B9DDZ5_9ARCH|nr:ABC transporter permease [Candidatus Prometheoarchaeum syntrophicum]QEE17468.1 FtsX-like permease family protein [Candidatus Prometheoarchaeum syntrophicum]
MSLNFAIKDLYYFKKQTIAHLKTNSSIIALVVLFLNLTNSMNLLTISSPISYLTLTLFELITQYHAFLVILIAILVFVVMINSNHAIVEHRKKDIGIMKAVGTYPNQLYSFYLTEVLLLAFFSFIIGWIIGMFLFFIIFWILNGRYVGLNWAPDTLISIGIFGGLLLVTFIVNGWEIRKIGLKSFFFAKTGKFKNNIHAKLTPTWKKIMIKSSISMKLAIKNLMRKQKDLRQSLALITIAGMIMLTGLIGVNIVNNSGGAYIHQAQGENIAVIGAPEVVEAFANGYSRFSNESIPALKEGTYTDISNNISTIEEQLTVYFNDYSIDLNYWEKRLFTVTTVTESLGAVIQYIYDPDNGTTSAEYVSVGNGTRTRVVPIQGINVNSSIQHWNYGGNFTTLTTEAAIGDTLAGELYENAYAQWIIYSNVETNRTYRHEVEAVVIDSMNIGNSVYIPLENLQGNLGRTNFSNLILVDYSKALENGQYNEFFDDISDILGGQFEIMDLDPIFIHNENFLRSNQITTLVLSSIIAMVIIYIIYQFQQGRLEEDKNDIIIFKALGGTTTDIRNMLFYEQAWLLFVGLTLSLTGTLFISIFFLLEKAEFPSIWVPLGLYALIFSFFSFLAYIGTRLLVKKQFQKIEHTPIT